MDGANISISAGYLFIPFAVEALCPWDHLTEKFPKNLCPKIIATGDTRAGFTAQM